MYKDKQTVFKTEKKKKMNKKKIKAYAMNT